MEDIHKSQREFLGVNDILSEVKNMLGGINSQLDTTVESSKNILKKD